MTSDGPRLYLAIKFHADHRNRALVDQIATDFEQHGLTTVCVARDLEEWGRVSFDAPDLMQRALGVLRRCVAVVVEFSEKGVGLGIEVGYAVALDIPVFVLLRDEAELSTTIEGVATHVFGYGDRASLKSAIVRIAGEIDRA